MDPGDNDEPSREELESRVEQLEETVSKMLPDRRGVLKGLGAAAIGGAAVGGATGGASGQSAAGQVGTESEPVDVEGAQGNFESVNTAELNGTYEVDRFGTGSDLGEKWNDTRSLTGGYNRNKFTVSSGEGYTITTPIDYTDADISDRHVIDLNGATIKVSNSNGVGFDFTGWGRGQVSIQNGTIIGDSTDTPDAAFLLAHDDSGGQCAFGHVQNVTFRGDFNVAPVIGVANEAWQWDSCEFNNDIAPEGSSCFNSQWNNQVGVTSPYNSIVTGNRSLSTNHFERCGFRHRAIDSGQGVVILNGIQQFTFDTCFVNSNDESEPIYHLPMTDNMYNLQLSNVMVDDGGALIDLDVPSGNDHRLIGLSIEGGKLSLSGSSLITASGAGTGRVLSSDIGFSTPLRTDEASFGAIGVDDLKDSFVGPSVDVATGTTLRNSLIYGTRREALSTSDLEENIYFQGNGSYTLDAVDLSTVGSPAGPEVRHSDGTNLTAGPAFHDSGTWYSLVDSTTYTP